MILFKSNKGQYTGTKMEVKYYPLIKLIHEKSDIKEIVLEAFARSQNS